MVSLRLKIQQENLIPLPLVSERKGELMIKTKIIISKIIEGGNFESEEKLFD